MDKEQKQEIDNYFKKIADLADDLLLKGIPVRISPKFWEPRRLPKEMLPKNYDDIREYTKLCVDNYYGAIERFGIN